MRVNSEWHRSHLAGPTGQLANTWSARYHGGDLPGTDTPEASGLHVPVYHPKTHWLPLVVGLPIELHIQIL